MHALHVDRCPPTTITKLDGLVYDTFDNLVSVRTLVVEVAGDVRCTRRQLNTNRDGIIVFVLGRLEQPVAKRQTHVA